MVAVVVAPLVHGLAVVGLHGGAVVVPGRREVGRVGRGCRRRRGRRRCRAVRQSGDVHVKCMLG